MMLVTFESPLPSELPPLAVLFISLVFGDPCSEEVFYVLGEIEVQRVEGRILIWFVMKTKSLK